MPTTLHTRAHVALRSWLVRVAVAVALAGTLVVSGGSAAWAGRVKPTHHGGGGGGTTGGTTSGGTSGGTTSGGSTGTIQYGYVIPITFSYASSSTRVLSLTSCPSYGHINYGSQVSFRTTDGGVPSMSQHVLLSISGPAYIWGPSATLTDSSGIATVTVIPYGSGTVAMTGYWDLDGNGSWNPSFEPAAAPTCIMTAS